MGRKEMKKRKRKKGRWWKIVLLIVVLLLIGGGVYAFTIFNNVKQTVNSKLHENVPSIDTEITDKKVDNKEPINILLLGVDERENDQGRSDTMIVMTLDPANNQMQLVSIPRDTKVKIAGDGRVTRINHAYAYGGSDMSVKTVENFLDIHIDYYVTMNMEGLAQLVNAVDGITVNNDMAFTQDGFQFPKGQLHLSGEEALAYVRMRKEDPKGDLGRNQRQRQVIQGVIDKAAGLNMINQIDEVMNVLGNNMKTNMEFGDMRRLAMNYSSARKNISTYQMSGNPITSSGMYLIEMPQSEIQKTHDLIVNFGS